jgi:RNA polymerase sigma factor (sigma-70 family)
MRADSVVTDLVVRASGGDRQAWDALVDRYAPLVWGICRRYQLRDAHAANVGQAVWLHLAGHLDSRRDPAALAGWLATTTRRECGRVLCGTRGPPADGRELQDVPDEQTATAEHELLAAERDAALRQAFARLPPAGQRLLAMLIADPQVPYVSASPTRLAQGRPGAIDAGDGTRPVMRQLAEGYCEGTPSTSGWARR